MSFDYSCLDYKQAIRQKVAAVQSLGKSLTYTAIARKTKVQKTYLSKVLNNSNSHFSRDQLFSVCTAVQFQEEEIDYCLLLHDYQTASHKSRRESLRKKLAQIQDKNCSTSKKIKATVESNIETPDLARYYLDVDATLLHMMLSIKKYADNIDQVSPLLGLPKERTLELMDLLQRLKLVEWHTTKRQAKILVNDRHLKRFHHLTAAHQSLMKMKSIEHVARTPEMKKLNFVVTFTADENTFNKLRSKVIQLVEDMRDDVKSSPSKGLYQFNLDLFPWVVS